MKTFKVGDRVRVKDECVGKEYRYPKDGGNGTIIGRESVELDWRVHLDKQRDRNDWWSYRESELILLEDTMECTVNGVTYRQLRNIAVTSLILAGARDNDIDFFARVYGYLPTIPINVALDYCTKGPHACNEKLHWLVAQGFVEVVEEALKPCPFCGGEAIWVTEDKNWIMCKECRTDGRLRKSHQDAIDAWNKRV